jgi:catechol 2,3-dioxygenase-like lactoylglutathione lyase family enzyme
MNTRTKSSEKLVRAPLRRARPERVPSLRGVFETALYAQDLAAADRFYGEVLGLRRIRSMPGRMVVFTCRDSILLIFNPNSTEKEQIIVNGAAIPLHGTRGAGHVAFRVPAAEIVAWRERLCSGKVAIESEVSWPNGAHSIYFRDPAGNSLELATPDMWSGPKS